MHLGEHKDPYLSISPKFAVLQAVPGVNTPTQNDRLPKNISPNQEASLLVPERFMPVPAVPAIPTLQTIESDVDLSDQVQVDDVANSVEVRTDPLLENEPEAAPPVRPVDQDTDFLAPSKERKQFKRCHGKCVQKFCLPVGNLSVFDKCTEKCKGVCTQ
eukprot:TRINITY_DN8671_c0_g1_i1.p2 TRINITY_DN8671_c0_g1~~TRINITY_DN8671_c0_g1_i1.p2  ORF type:complete len:159 (-),score=26.24 TRINITY_DN8671_c0_g1_i1:40-516(-)